MATFSSIAVSPSGTTLLNTTTVTTGAGSVRNEVVTLGDSTNGANVGTVLASGAILTEPGGANVQPVSGTIKITDTPGNGVASVFDIANGNTITDMLATGLFSGSGIQAWVGSIPGPGVPDSVLAVGIFDANGNQAATDGSGNLNVNLQAAANPIPTLPEAFSGSVPPGGGGSNVNLALQSDYVGSLFTKPFRRSQTVSKGTTIASSGSATSVLPVQGAGVFADLTQFVITATPAAVTAVSFTATLSDGTATYIFDINTGVVGTLAQPPLVINFNPALPATTANTAWTVQLSSSSVTVHITVVAVLQQAS